MRVFALRPTTRLPGASTSPLSFRSPPVRAQNAHIRKNAAASFATQLAAGRLIFRIGRSSLSDEHCPAHPVRLAHRLGLNYVGE